MELRKIYEYALSREYEGKRFYEENSKRLNHAAAVNAFIQLAGEEQKHIDFIRHHLEMMNKGQTSEPDYGMKLEQEGFFSQRAQSEVIDQTVAEAMVPDLPVLRMAYLIERDFAEFYEESAERVEGEAKQALTMLAQWEHRHEQLFKQYFDEAFTEYANMPWGG